ncbi:hypothetical protein [Dasania marina]|uniref:hypothetical protein n=1 Tax=Dasania marina TaxID=471499 RepID=UPI00036F98EF|nr:hypothetical protein [Dasania marina]
MLSLKTKLIAAAVFVTVVAVATGYVLWHMSTPQKFQLDISNETDIPIQQVTVFGMGVYRAQSVADIAPDQFATIIVNLKTEGDLRFSIEQGFTSIDYSLAQDVTRLEQFKQWLTVEPGNRFIVKDVE